VNRLFSGCLLGTILSLPAWGQKVEVQKQDRSQVFHVRTALQHLTVLEMAEPVRTVAVGSTAFKVEWRENRVFIQPLEPNVTTNLFVWTASARFNYELGPAGPVEEMHFAIEQPAPDPPSANHVAAAAPVPDAPGATEVLVDSKPVRTDRVRLRKDRVGVLLTETFQFKDQLFIRFVVRNEGKKPYAPGTPQVVAVISGRFRQSLYGLSNVQLGEKDAARLKTNGQSPLEVVAHEIRSTRLELGQETIGVVGVKLPGGYETPLVVRLIFPAGPAGPVTAVLVR
jgi:hypothetical protein